MPQLDVTTWPPQLIWLAIAFLTLFFIMRFVALPRVGGVIEGRKKRVNDDLEAAQRFKLETEKAISDYEAALAAARAKGHAIAQEAHDKLTEDTEQQRAKVEAGLKQQVVTAERRIAELKAKAMGEVERVAGDLAAEIVHELAGIKTAKRGSGKTAKPANRSEEK